MQSANSAYLLWTPKIQIVALIFVYPDRRHCIRPEAAFGLLPGGLWCVLDIAVVVQRSVAERAQLEFGKHAASALGELHRG